MSLLTEQCEFAFSTHFCMLSERISNNPKKSNLQNTIAAPALVQPEVNFALNIGVKMKVTLLGSWYD